MKNLKNKMFAILKDESAQGMAEYALLLVVIVAIAFIFRDKIKDAVSKKMQDVGSSITGFTG